MTDELEELQEAAVKEIENAYRIGRKVERQRVLDEVRDLLDDEAADLLGICDETDEPHRAEQFEYQPDKTGTGGSYWCCIDCWKKIENRPLIDAVTEIGKVRRRLDEIDQTGQ